MKRALIILALLAFCAGCKGLSGLTLKGGVEWGDGPKIIVGVDYSKTTNVTDTAESPVVE